LVRRVRSEPIGERGRSYFLKTSSLVRMTE
jgi:hypothetical protein